GLLDQAAGTLGETAELVVVMHHGFAVGGKLDVAFDREIAGHGRPRGGRHVLDHASRGIVQTAMGDRAGGQPVRCAHQATSNTPSTSTAASDGSAATPTVVRACRPLSPNTATIRSDAP